MKDLFQSDIFAFLLIGVGIAVVAALWFGWRGRFRDKAKQLLLSFVIVAEQRFGRGTGPIKFAYAAEKLYAVMPHVFKWFFSAETVGKWIEDAVLRMKELLSEPNAMMDTDEAKEDSVGGGEA